MPATASSLEIIYSLGAVLGILATGFVLFEALKDLRSAGSPPDEMLLWIAWGNLIVVFVAAYHLLLFLSIGIYAMGTPDSPNPTIGARLVGYGFLGSEIVLVVLMWGILWGRRRVELLFRQQQQKRARRAKR